jgi:hypothetical protein
VLAYAIKALLVYVVLLLTNGDVSTIIYDPENELRPLLKEVKIGTLELEGSNQNYDCALAILGPFQRERKYSRDRSAN